MPFLGDGVEGPQQLARRRVIGFDKPTNTVFATIGTDQNLTVNDRGRHGFAVTFFGIRNFGLPQNFAGFGVQRYQLGIQCAHEQLATFNRNATVVGPATEGGDRPHFVFVVPKLLTGHGIQRIDMVVGGCHVHDAVHHDGRCFHRLTHFGLECEDGLELFDVTRVDLLAGVKARLGIVTVGVQPVSGLIASAIQLGLCYVDALGNRHRTTPNALLALNFLRVSGARQSTKREHGTEPFSRLGMFHLLLH